jgi:hypothetical protein
VERLGTDEIAITSVEQVARRGIWFAGSIRMRCGIIGTATGALLIFKGKYKIVLINYPHPAQKDAIVLGALVKTH